MQFKHAIFRYMHIYIYISLYIFIYSGSFDNDQNVYLEA